MEGSGQIHNLTASSQGREHLLQLNTRLNAPQSHFDVPIKRKMTAHDVNLTLANGAINVNTLKKRTLLCLFFQNPIP
jgi:hypothetical protein